MVDDSAQQIPIAELQLTIPAAPVAKGRHKEGDAAGWQHSGKAGEGDADTTTVGYFKLLSTADKLDCVFMAVGTLGGLANGLMMPLFALSFGQFTDAFANGFADVMPRVSKVALDLVFLAIGVFVAFYLQSAFWMWSGNRQSNRLRQRYVESLLCQDVAFFDISTSSGSVLQGLQEDVATVQAAISERVGSMVQHLTTLVVGLSIAFVKGWDMTLVLLCCMPLMAAALLGLARVTSSTQAAVSRAYAGANDAATQAITHVRTVLAYGQEARAVSAYDSALAPAQRAGVFQGLLNGASIGALLLALFCSYAAALYYGAWRVSQGAMTGGAVLSVMFAALLGCFSIGQAAPLLQFFARGRVAGARVFAVIERAAPIDARACGTTLPSVRGHVVLQAVAFAYPARPCTPVLSEFNLSIAAGTTVALVGGSGSGKSTVVSLVQRFYDPQVGQVLLDGVNVRSFDVRWFRKQLALVSQEPTLFEGSIHDNIALGSLDGATREQVEEAARAANVHGFVSRLPDGYDTQVGERGLALSGGQKQRICIARAILRNPKVLLLDEATSALDTHSERLVQAALDRVSMGRTTIMVAHRLSTVQKSDVIVVVQQGLVVERGAPKDLLAIPNGHFSRLASLQAQRGCTADASTQGTQPLGSAPDVVYGMACDVTAIQPEHEGAGEADDCLQASIRTEQPPEQVGHAECCSGHQNLDAARPYRGLARDQDGAGQGPGPKDCLRGAAAAGQARQPNPFSAAADLAGSGSSTLVPAQQLGEQGARQATSQGSLFMRLVRMNKGESHYLLLGSMGSLGHGAINPSFAFVLSTMISTFYVEDKGLLMQHASGYALALLAIGLLGGSCVVLQLWALGLAAQRLAHRVRVALLSAILRQEVGFFDLPAHSSGRLGTLLSSDALAIRGAAGDVLGAVLQSLGALLFGYAVAFLYDWRMALVVTAALPLLVSGAVISTKYSIGQVDGAEGLYGPANQRVAEAVGVIRTVHAYNLQAHVAGGYRTLLSSADRIALRNCHLSGLALGYSQWSLFVVIATIVWFGGLEVQAGRAGFEEMLKAFLSVVFAAIGVAQAAVSFPELGSAKAAAKRVLPVMDRVSAIDAQDDSLGMVPGQPPLAELQLRDVSFSYPARPSVLVFSQFNLIVPAGRTMALVGESGSGKSTVVSLVERFYDPQSGAVLLDGVDIRSLSVRWLRQQIGLVSQEPLLFTGTILDNILFGCPGASLSQAMAAAQAADAHDFISGLPAGYDTPVAGLGCIQLSGGQKQRIAIARAIIKEPRILLLDEATSALDAQAEAAVQAALDAAAVGRTCIVVAHRLSTIRNAHAIAVVSHGTIVEQGTHAQLVARGTDGAYARLVAAQAFSGGGP